tara:strand:+ start:150 stop:1127 length:978 start_codon:yes stop_codon:yes gene_type:complete
MIQIIGGSGFVGSFLMNELVGFKIQNLDKRQSPFFSDRTIIGDITKNNQINFNEQIDTVILLAAEHKDDVSPVSKYYDVNVQGTINILEKMDEFGIKNLIFTSSVAIYGLNKNNPDENHIHDPFNHYGKSKWQAEKEIKAWFDKDPRNKSVTIIRPTVIFGERNRGNVYNLLKQISSGKFLMIGKGQNKKSMSYVGNVVAFIKHRIEKNQLGYNVYNYVDKPDLTMNELVLLVEKKMQVKIPKFKIPYFIGIFGGLCFDLIAFLTNKKFSISCVRVKKFCAVTQFDSSKVENIFEPPFSLEEGLNKTLVHEFLNSKKDNILFYTE